MSAGVFEIGRVQKKRLDARYEVGDDGVIYSDGLALEPIAGVGVNLHGERRKICYLVARAFVANPAGRPYVRHKNGNVRDNRAVNLEWCEQEEKQKRGPKPRTRYCAAWTVDGEKVGIWPNVSEAAVATGVSLASVRNALAGRQKTAGGLLWRWGA